MADTSKSDSELEEELVYTPEVGKKMRKVRDKYKNVILKKRLRASSVGSLDNFVKRKRVTKIVQGRKKVKIKGCSRHHYQNKKKTKMRSGKKG